MSADVAAPALPELEDLVAATWAEVLDVERVEPADDFFDLGGHSLSAIRMASRLRAAAGREIDLRDVFECRTVAALAARMELLPAVTVEARPIAAAQAGELPLSYGQERLWFLHQVNPESAAYHLAYVVRVQGPLSLDAVEEALDLLVERHAVLRTRFEDREGRPVQVIEADARIPVMALDLAGLEPDAREAEVARRCADEGRRPFDLGHGSPARVLAMRLGPEEHVLSLVLHHVASDGWSMAILFRELVALYRSVVTECSASLPRLPVQYADYARWQRETLARPAMEERLEHWRRRLTGAPPLLELPADHLRPSVKTYEGDVITFPVPSAVTARLGELAAAHGATLSMALLTAFLALLHRYTQETDLVVGMPVAGRSRPELEPLIGFFVNTLVLRGDVSGDPTFRELLERVRELALEAYAHEDVPFEWLVEALQPERDLAKTPLVQVVFNFQGDTEDRGPSLAERTQSLGGLTWTPVVPERRAAQFDLMLSLSLTAAGLNGAVEYSTDLFERETVERMVAHLLRLLESATDEPGRRLSELELLTEAERDTLERWEPAEVDWEWASPSQLFEAQARRHPDAVAVEHGGGSLTYRELDAWAEGVAAWLAERGMGPERLVGVRLDGAELVAALWGVLKAGAAFVPLGPREPDASLDLVLAQAPRAPASAPGPSPHPNGAALVAGGLLFEQAAVAGRLRWMQERFSLGAGDVFCWAGAPTWEALLLPGVVGGRLVLPAPGDLDAAALVRLVAERRVTVLSLVPTLLPRFLADDDVGRCTSLRHVLCAGEPLPAPVAARAQARLRGVQVHGLHDPVECAPAGVTRHVLDPYLRPQPAGVTGGLHVGGEGVARGVHGRPGLTAERFPPDPFGAPGARLQSTGLDARRRPDGTIQRVPAAGGVRLRGYRVDPGQVEAALLSHEDVLEAVVTVEGSAHQARAVAHLALRRLQGRLTTAELRKHLQRSGLPDVMLPSRFVYRPELPRLPDGRPDRRALVGAGERAVREAGYVAPRTKTEAVLAALSAELLGVAQVGVHDDFFEVGGNSLLAAQLVARARLALEVDLPLRLLFQTPTVADLARVADTEQTLGEDPTWSPLVLIQAGDGVRPLYGLAPLGGQSLCYFHVARNLSPRQPFYGLQPPEVTPPEGITVEEMAESFASAIVEFQPEPPYHLCGWSFGGVMAFETAQQLVRQGREVALLAIIDTFPGPYGPPWQDPLGPEVAALLTIFENDRTLQLRADMLASEELMSLSTAERFKLARDWFEREGLLAPDTPLSWLRQIEHGWSSRLVAQHEYVFQPYPGPITVFRTEWDFENSSIDTWPEFVQRRIHQRALGWEDFCTHPEPVEVCIVPGDHQTLVYGTHAVVLAGHLMRKLAEAART